MLFTAPFKHDLRFICVCNSKILLLLEVEVGGHKVQQILSHQLGLQGDRHVSITLLMFAYNMPCMSAVVAHTALIEVV